MKVTVKFEGDWKLVQPSSGGFFSTQQPEIFKGTAKVSIDKHDYNITCVLHNNYLKSVEGELPDGITLETLTGVYEAFKSKPSSIYEVDSNADDINVLDQNDNVISNQSSHNTDPVVESVNSENSPLENSKETKVLFGSCEELIEECHQEIKNINGLLAKSFFVSSFNNGLGFGVICAVVGTLVCAFASIEIGVALIVAGLLAALIGYVLQHQQGVASKQEVVATI